RASSTWKHDTRKFGPLNALDKKSDAAWKSAPSEESNPLAYYEIYFQQPVNVREVRIQFQGGFVGTECTVFKKNHNIGNNDGGEWEEFEDLFIDPVESSEVQVFSAEEGDSAEYCSALRIEFERSTDFYGRIVIYSFEVWGYEIPINSN
ncbi:hypothetical protein ACHAXS_010181, partial [Conticribra weissflogii]